MPTPVSGQRHLHDLQPAAGEPSWGDFIPQHLGFELCQRMRSLLTAADRQGCLPERLALEVLERYPLDVEGTVRWLDNSPA